MYKFHYKHIWVKYGRDATLLFTDVVMKLRWCLRRFLWRDFYSKKFQFYDLANKKLIGKVKDDVREMMGLIRLGCN